MSRVCRAPIRAAIGDAFSDEEIDVAIDDLKKRFRQKKSSGLDDAEAMELAREEALSDALLSEAIERRNTVYAALAKSDRDRVFGEDGLSDPKRVAAFLVGDESGLEASGSSVDAVGRAMSTQIWTDLFADLRNHNLLERITDPFNFGDTVEFQSKVANEMAILNGSKVSRPSSDPEALTVAKAFVRALEASRKLQNDNGAWIRHMPGYVVRQTHDAVKMTGGFFRGMVLDERVAREAWIDEILPLLDEETFARLEVDTPQARRDYLELIYANIVSGDHLHSSTSAFEFDGFVPPPNKARSVSAARVLHFKSADSWMQYNQKYGQGSLIDAVFQQIDRSGRNAALLRAFGPSPEAAFKSMIESGAEQAKRAGRAKDASALTGWKMRARFEEVSGIASAPESVRLSALSRGIRQWQSLSKLGGMLLSSVTDIAFASDTMVRAGGDFLSSYEALTRSIAGLDGEARQEVARALGASTRIMAGEVSSRFNPLDGANGVMGRLTAIFYKVNGFTPYQNRVRRGAAAYYSALLGGQSSKSFADLDPNMQEGLRRFRIEPDLWEVLRREVQDLGGDEGLFLTLDAAETADPKSLARALGYGTDDLSLERAQREAKTRLQSYFLTLTDDALTEPRARERAILRMGSQTGTIAGVFWELATQFKSFPTSVVLRHSAPALRQAMNGEGMAVVNLVVSGMALGYLALQMKQIARAREPLPMNANTIIASMMQGGGLGIYGDFLMADFNRFGRSAFATMAGPAIGEIEGMLMVMSAIRSEERDGAAAKAIRLISGNIPFANLFYTRAALDYGILYRLQEAASPGYLERYERRIEEETGADFILSPRVSE